jgi:hypothetical protein
MVRQVFFILLLVLGTIFFMVGLHGIDNAWNLSYVENVSGGEWTDSSLFGGALSGGQLYSQSVLLTLVGFMIAVIAAIMIYGRF